MLLANLLNLEGWNTFPISESDVDLLVPAEYTTTPTVCVRCGVADPSLKRHGFQKQRFMDTPMHGKRVGIMVKRQRFKCLECGQTFHQPIPDMDEKRHMTRRLVEYIERRSLERTFTEVAADIGVDEKTIRNIFRENVAKLDARYEPQTPEPAQPRKPGNRKREAISTARNNIRHDDKVRGASESLHQRAEGVPVEWLFLLEGFPRSIIDTKSQPLARCRIIGRQQDTPTVSTERR